MTSAAKAPDATNTPPFETEDLRANLAAFLDAPFQDPSGQSVRVGHYRWGVYAFFDYDGEPIYVGQTNERLRTRIRRHLTNQRTDAVAMSVLDPFEVFEIEVWPLPQFEQTDKSSKEARAHLDALERLITQKAVDEPRFKAILNEKDPPTGDLVVDAPPSYRARIVSDRVFELRSHPDFRIARRALIISRLAQVIRALAGTRSSPSLRTISISPCSPSRPIGAARPNSAMCAWIVLESSIRWRISVTRVRWITNSLCCSGLFTSTKRMLGLVTASQIASASAASFFCRFR